jgi:hypothetical protein
VEDGESTANISSPVVCFSPSAEGIPPRFVTFHRRVVDDSVSDAIDDMAQTHAATPLTEVEYHENGVIEDALHSLQADFANKFLGQFAAAHGQNKLAEPS